MENFREIEGKKIGSINYIHEEFIYKKNREIKGVLYLKCTKTGCPATATLTGHTLRPKKAHNHEQVNRVSCNILCIYIITE